MTAAIKEAAWQAKMLGANGDARELDLRQRRAEGAAGDAPKLGSTKKLEMKKREDRLRCAVCC